MGMRLKDVKIRNFGPFYGEQSAEFNPERPIALIHGDNMRGKTSFLNAIRWALYGYAPDRLGRKIPLTKLVNWDASASGDWTMSVELDFDVDGVSYDLARAAQPADPTVTPVVDSHFEVKLFLKRGGHHLNPDEAQTAINRVLPEQISQFFLFDGEFLNDYEILLSTVDKQAQAVKESIEDILGVPALTNAIADLHLNLGGAAQRQRRLASKIKSAEIYAAEAGRLERAITQQEKEIAQLKDQREELSRQRQELDEILKATALIEVDVQRLEALDGQMGLMRNEQQKLLDEKRDKLAVAWQDILQPRIRQELQRLEAERDDQLSKVQQAGELRGRLRALEMLDETGECPVCGWTREGASCADLEDRKRQVEDALTHHGFDQERLSELTDSIRRLKGVKQAGVIDTIQLIERELADIHIGLHDLQFKTDEVQERLKSHDRTEIGLTRRKFEELGSDLILIEDAMIAKQTEIAFLNNKAAANRAEIRKVGGPELKGLSREVELYEQLISLFERALDRLRDDVRKSVEKTATDIFLQLTTDKSYTGLRINEYYGLAIVDAQGGEVAVRSAGAEQIVALSLIGALNQNAVRSGPIIMDTPFGRLDPSHRENILKFVPTMAEQIILLVHGGEVDRERDLAHIRDKIDREYKINYVSSRRSELVRIKG